MVVITPYQPHGPEQFSLLGSALRQAYGLDALAIHHIGSTAVPGLPAKDVIDIQLTVVELDGFSVVPLRDLGCQPRLDITHDHRPPGFALEETELAKRYFVQHSPRPVHLQVRAQSRFNQRYALPCRDDLRANPAAQDACAEIKWQLARHFPNDEEAYSDVKAPVFDLQMSGARLWAEQVRWAPLPTDAQGRCD